MKLRLGIVFFTIFLLASCNGDQEDTEKTTVSTPKSQTNKPTGTQLETNTNQTGDLPLEVVIKKPQEEFVPATTGEEENPEAVSDEELETSSEKIEEEFIEESPEMEEGDPEDTLEEDVPEEEPEEEFVNPEEQEVINPEE